MIDGHNHLHTLGALPKVGSPALTSLEIGPLSPSGTDEIKFPAPLLLI